MLSILDKETLTGGSCGSFLSKMAEVEDTKTLLELSKIISDTSFIIKHHGGPVTYSATDFIGEHTPLVRSIRRTHCDYKT